LLSIAQDAPAGQAPSQPSPSQSGSTPPAQEQGQKPSGQTENLPKAPSTTKDKLEKEIEKKEQSYRVMGVVPLFGTTNRQDAPPLTPKEKFHLFVKSAFDPVIFVLIGAQAGISQAQDSFPAYGQGAEGYAKTLWGSVYRQRSIQFLRQFFLSHIVQAGPAVFSAWGRERQVPYVLRGEAGVRGAYRLWRASIQLL
jgi:hypothetical protein